MKIFFAIAFLFLSLPALAVHPSGGTVSLSAELENCGNGMYGTNCPPGLVERNVACTPPTTRTDGAALAGGEISYYTFRAVKSTNDAVIVHRASSCSFSVKLRSGTWAIQIMAWDTGGRNSLYSSSINHVVP